MGIDTNAASAPYKVSAYWVGDSLDKRAPHLVRCCMVAGGLDDGQPMPEGWPERIPDKGSLPLGHGWSIEVKCTHFPKPGKYCVFVLKIFKGKLAVYEIDEHPYSNGGAVMQSFISKDRRSITAFCKDFGIKKEIEKDAIAQQTI